MKGLKAFVVLAMVLMMVSGCASAMKAVNTIEGTITGTVVPDVCAAADYYTKYIHGVVSIAGGLIPAVTPYVVLANTAIGALEADCKSGALAARIKADILKVDDLIQQINRIVGGAKK